MMIVPPTRKSERMALPTLRDPCPICDGAIPNEEQVGEYPGAMSRFDNKREICSACGTAEALMEAALHSDPHKDRSLAVRLQDDGDWDGWRGCVLIQRGMLEVGNY